MHQTIPVRSTMRSDDSQHLLAAAQKRSSQTRRRAEVAIGRLTDAGTAVTFDSVAGEARRVPFLALRPTRPAHRNRPAPGTPPRMNTTRHATRHATRGQRASETSLLRRLEAATDRIRKLKHGNRELKNALAQALGQNRHFAGHLLVTARPA